MPGERFVHHPNDGPSPRYATPARTLQTIVQVPARTVQTRDPTIGPPGEPRAPAGRDLRNKPNNPQHAATRSQGVLA